MRRRVRKRVRRERSEERARGAIAALERERREAQEEEQRARARQRARAEAVAHARSEWATKFRREAIVYARVRDEIRRGLRPDPRTGKLRPRRKRRRPRSRSAGSSGSSSGSSGGRRRRRKRATQESDGEADCDAAEEERARRHRSTAKAAAKSPTKKRRDTPDANAPAPALDAPRKSQRRKHDDAPPKKSQRAARKKKIKIVDSSDNVVSIKFMKDAPAQTKWMPFVQSESDESAASEADKKQAKARRKERKALNHSIEGQVESRSGVKLGFKVKFRKAPKEFAGGDVQQKDSDTIVGLRSVVLKKRHKSRKNKSSSADTDDKVASETLSLHDKGTSEKSFDSICFSNSVAGSNSEVGSQSYMGYAPQNSNKDVSRDRKRAFEDQRHQATSFLSGPEQSTENWPKDNSDTQVCHDLYKDHCLFLEAFLESELEELAAVKSKIGEENFHQKVEETSVGDEIETEEESSISSQKTSHASVSECKTGDLSDAWTYTTDDNERQEKMYTDASVSPPEIVQLVHACCGSEPEDLNTENSNNEPKSDVSAPTEGLQINADPLANASERSGAPLKKPEEKNWCLGISHWQVAENGMVMKCGTRNINSNLLLQRNPAGTKAPAGAGAAAEGSPVSNVVVRGIPISAVSHYTPVISLTLTPRPRLTVLTTVPQSQAATTPPSVPPGLVAQAQAQAQAPQAQSRSRTPSVDSGKTPPLCKRTRMGPSASTAPASTAPAPAASALKKALKSSLNSQSFPAPKQRGAFPLRPAIRSTSRRKRSPHLSWAPAPFLESCSK